MDTINNYIEFLFQSLSYNSDYNAYVFIFLLLSFGVITYYLSIKVNQPTIEDQKIFKKRSRKEKIVKNKNFVKDYTVKPQTANVLVTLQSKIEEKIAEIEPTDTNDSGLWIPVQNPKKNSKQRQNKNTKKNSKTSPELEVSAKPTIENNKSQSVAITSVCDNIVADEEITLPIITQCEKVDCIREETTIKEQECGQEKCLESNVDEEEEVMDTGVVRQTESPTNSSSDDFVLVECCKMSSDEAVTIEEESGTIEDPIDTSVTSGASRKKTKKYQKIISRQLIEAAIIEGDERQPSAIVVEEVAQTVSSKKSLVVKKRRPRKDD